MKALLERQDPEYRKLADEICTTHITFPGLQAVLKLLLAERVSIRNLHLIIEAIAEIAPHVRRTEQIVEHVRVRMAQQICGDLSEGGVLKVLRLGNRWDLAFHQSLKRDAKGEIREFDIDPRQLEEFGAEATKAIRGYLEAGERFVIVTAPDARPYVRMIIERLFTTLPVLPMSKSPRAWRSASSAPSREHRHRNADYRGVSGLLPHRQLLHADAGPVQRPRRAAGPPFRGGRRHLCADGQPVGSDRPLCQQSADRPGAAGRVRNPDRGLIGMLARIYMLAMSFIGTAVANLIGFTSVGGISVEGGEPQGPLGDMIGFSALMLLFVFDFHHEIVKALVESYQVAPLSGMFDPRTALVNVTDTISEAFFIVIRLGSPFIAYAILINVTIGFVNKLTPQVPVYFISCPS